MHLKCVQIYSASFFLVLLLLLIILPNLLLLLLLLLPLLLLNLTLPTHWAPFPPAPAPVARALTVSDPRAPKD